jgi:hypothetical protein
MKLNFDDIKNKEKGKIGIVCGLGGSLKEHLSKLEELSKDKDNYCTISCNRYNTMTKLDVDYWVVANSVFTVKDFYKTFNSMNATLVYADSVDTTDKKFVDNNLKIDYISYDQRHFKGQPCSRRLSCCSNIQPGRLTIQEYLQKMSGHNEHYRDAGTVGIHMIALAVILGCNPIYVSGIDMDYKTGYVNGSKVVKHDDIGKYQSSFNAQVKIIVESAEKLGIDIINLNHKSPFDSMKKGEFIEVKCIKNEKNKNNS